MTWFTEHIGYDTAPRDYYSPIPDLRRLPDSVWDEPSALNGITLALDQQMSFLEQDPSPFVAEFNPPSDPDGNPRRFFLHNGTYESVDAEILYAMIRFLRPKRIIELGSGRSTQVIALARARNRSDGASSSYRVVDPHPTELTRQIAAGSFELDEISATQVSVDDFAQLAANDVLFVDTTHTVKLGSDVNYIVLEVLPTLSPGVVVHFHDIFLPWSYPREWLTHSRRFWTEQYLLQAFLAFNSRFEPLLAAHALSRRYPDRLRKAVPSFGPDIQPGAFWLRRSHD